MKRQRVYQVLGLEVQTCTRPLPHVCTLRGGPCNGWPREVKAGGEKTYAAKELTNTEIALYFRDAVVAVVVKKWIIDREGDQQEGWCVNPRTAGSRISRRLWDNPQDAVRGRYGRKAAEAIIAREPKH
jgi:hypothetical protein